MEKKDIIEGNGNKFNLNIIEDKLKIEINCNSKEYLGIFSLNYFQKDYKIFSLFGIEGIKDFINQRILKKEYIIINNFNNLKLTLLLDEDNNIVLIIPFNDKKREASLEKIIQLETEFINLDNKINEMKLKLKKELKEEIMKEVKKEIIEKENKTKNTINENILKEINNKRPKILFQKKYNYSSSIVIHETTLTEVPYYTNEFITEQIYSIVQVNINIPFTYISESGHGKILTYLDDEMICDSTIYAPTNVIRPLTIIGYIQNLCKGKHIVKIMACSSVGEGVLNLPHINPDCIEYTLKPIVSGNITIIGF